MTASVRPACDDRIDVRRIVRERRCTSRAGCGPALSAKPSALLAGFASFEHYCSERLGMAPRTVEQRAELERRLWAIPELRAARDAGMPYEKLRLLSRLDPRHLAEWVPRARNMTVAERRRSDGSRGVTAPRLASEGRGDGSDDRRVLAA